MTDVARQLVYAARDARLEGDYRRAIYLCNQAIQHDSLLLDAHAVLKECQDDLVVDEIVFAHDAASPAEARRICDELLEHVPNCADLFFTRGLFQESKEAAQADFEMVLELEAKATDAEAVERRAEALELLGRAREAERAWSRLIALDRRNVDAWNGRAMNRLNEHKIKEALEDLDRVFELEPRNARALAQLADAQLLSGQFEAATKRASEARSEGYDGTYLDVVEGEALVRLDRYAEALAKLEPHAKDFSLDADELTTYARVLTELGRSAEAVTLLEERVSHDDRDADWHSVMAHALCEAGRCDDARQHLDEALSHSRRALEGREFDSVYGLAWCLAHRAALAEKHSISGVDVDAERDEAAKLLKRAIDKDDVLILYARSAREFDSFWSRPELAEYA